MLPVNVADSCEVYFNDASLFSAYQIKWKWDEFYNSFSGTKLKGLTDPLHKSCQQPSPPLYVLQVGVEGGGWEIRVCHHRPAAR